ncbi:flavodoxin family protein [Carboxydocella sp. JDF658]|uniref:flavodoxin family protein n=1 Tax=Carboxydocella sp. JDF658 TaxID=1926600 RepID=UPI0009ACAC5E|nr:flavodoxin family protein [Carboxydocella sp. JDF658]GAW30826.1 NADPH-dependent FMN reductase [Carboxydocella sp. JDF658]
MLIIGINGSPRQDGNSGFLLEQALKGAATLGAQTEIIQAAEILADVKVPFCTVCTNPCAGVCAHNNKLGETYELLKKADGIIMASPVYFGTVSGQLKAFWDKTRYLRRDKHLLNVVGAAIACGASRFGGQETAVAAMHDMMLVHGMVIVGDGFAELDCGHQGVGAQKPAEQDQDAVRRAEMLGKRVAQVALATAAIRRR